MMQALSRSSEIRTEHWLFEPQLAGGLAWLLAVIMLAIAALAGSMPPELLSLLCGGIALLLSLRWLVPKSMHRPYAYLVVDWRRDIAYLSSVLVLVGLGLVGIVGVQSLPGCRAHELDTALELPDLGTFHVADIATTLIACGLTLLEPLCFRRSLAVQYVWPTSSASYWMRWGTRLAYPLVVVLVLSLGMHRLVAGRLWGPRIEARSLMQVLIESPDKKVPSSLAAKLGDPAVVDELVTLAMCQPDEELVRRLVEIPLPRRATTAAWKQMIESVQPGAPR